MKSLMAVVALLLLLGACTQQDSSHEQAPTPATTAELPKPQKQPARPTWDTTPADLVNRYNTQAIKVDKRLMLPPVGSFERVDAPENTAFYVIRHEVIPAVWVLIEIDRRSEQPFSIGIWGAGDPDNLEHNVLLMAAQTSAAAAVFGPGEDAGAPVRLCGTLGKGKSSDTTTVRGMNVYCGMTGGLWMAGVSVPNKTPAQQ